MIPCPRCGSALQECFDDPIFFNFLECEECWMAFCFSQGIIGQGRRFSDLSRGLDSLSTREDLAREAEAAGSGPPDDTIDGTQFDSARPLKDFFVSCKEHRRKHAAHRRA